MKKQITILFTIAILLLASLTFNPVSSEGSTIHAMGTTYYVDDDNTEGPWDGTIAHPYQHIQDAINASSDGDTVFVYRGIYTQDLVIDKSINVIGEDKTNTIIQSEQSVDIKADEVTIKELTLDSNDSYYDLRVLRAKWCKITNNIIRGNIRIYLSSNISINNNIIQNLTNNGLRLDGSGYNVVKNNDITVCNDGILIDSAYDNNKLCRSWHNTIDNNKIYCNNLSDCDKYKKTGVIVGSNYNKVTNNEIYGNFGCGVITESAKYNIINKNVVDGANIGIWVSHSFFNLIIFNDFTFINEKVNFTCRIPNYVGSIKYHIRCQICPYTNLFFGNKWNRIS